MTRLALTLVFALGCTAAQADTEICQSVNGRTTCTQAEGNVSCVTINGETRCTRPDPDRVQPPQSLPDIAAPGVDIRSEDGRLRLRAGGTEILLPH